MADPTEDMVTLLTTLDDGTSILQHSDGRLERTRSQTDWARFDAITDEEIEEAVRNDPDAVPLDLDWSDAVLIMPARKKAISIRLDEDVLDFFKREGGGYQRRINAVLRSYMEQTSKKRA